MERDGLVWVIDSADRLRVQDCKDELFNLLTEDRLMGASLLVLANKQDLIGSMTIEDMRQRLALDSIRTHSWKLLPCSAVTGQNLMEGFDWIVTDIASRLYYSLTPKT